MSSLTLATGSCCKSQTTDVRGDKEWLRQNKLSTLRRTHPRSLASMRNTNTDNNTYTNTDRALRRTHPRLRRVESQHTQIQIQTQIPITTHTKIHKELSDEPIRASSLASMRSAVGSQQIQIQIQITIQRQNKLLTL